MTVIIKESSS